MIVLGPPIIYLFSQVIQHVLPVVYECTLSDNNNISSATEPQKSDPCICICCWSQIDISTHSAVIALPLPRKTIPEKLIKASATTTIIVVING